MVTAVRAKERGLLLWVSVFMLIGLGILVSTRPDLQALPTLVYGGVIIGLFWLVNIFLQPWGRGGDAYLFPLQLCFPRWA